MIEKKNVLMIANTDTSLNGFLVLARIIYERNKYFPVILCEGKLRIGDLIEKNGIDVKRLRIEELPDIYKAKANLIKKVCRKLSTIFSKWLFWGPISVIENMDYILKYSKIMREHFEKYRPKALVVYTDRRGGYERAAIYHAKKCNIPIVIPSVSHIFFQQFFNNPHNGVYFKKEKRLPFIYRIAKKVNNNWVAEYEDNYVFFHNAQRLLAANILKMCNMNPWVLGATKPTLNANADIDSYFETVKILGDDIASDSLAFTTNIEMYYVKKSLESKDEIRQKLKKKYNMQGDTIIIFSAVPYHEAGITDLEYNQDIHEKVISYLSKQDTQILVSLHPKMEKDNYLFLENYDNVVIVEEPLRDIIGCADIFVSCEESATKQWAVFLKMDMILLPEKWFRNSDEYEIKVFFDKFTENIIKDTEKKEAEMRLDFMELFFSILEEKDIKPIIKKQFQALNIRV